jgi:hypothetical protein
MHKLYLKLKSDKHIQLIESLINLTVDNFAVRYCDIDKDTLIVTPNKYLICEPEINFYNYVWDCFIHVFKRDLFQEIHYLDVTSKDEIYNAILCIIDCEIFNNDITDSEDTNDR